MNEPLPGDLPVADGVEFRPVVGYPLYAVGDDGSIWRWVGPSTWRKLNPWRHKVLRCKAYPQTSLCRPNPHSRKTFLVHRLVLEAFVGPCPPGMEACHNDGDPTNARLSNLRWDTPSANMEDQARHGTLVCGEKVHTAKLTEAEVREIRRLLANGCKARELSKLFGVHYMVIWRIRHGKSWKRLREPQEVI